MANREDLLYRTFSTYMKEKYGDKVYKLPISLPLTCPNRDGTKASGGCIFCSGEGGSFENLCNSLSVSEQLNANRAHISKRYGAKYFIAYLQSFSNTYMPVQKLRSILDEILINDIVEVYISTRPDCISDGILNLLSEYNKKIPICVELGLQSVNDNTLKILNRGHDLADFIDSCIRLNNENIRICAHVIADLPWDSEDDVKRAARILSALGVDEVKLHSLYVVEGTKLADMVQRGKVYLLTEDDFKSRVLMFLRHLKRDIVVQRIIGRAPKDETVFCNWSHSWWKIRDEIVDFAVSNGIRQGDLFEEFNVIQK